MKTWTRNGCVLALLVGSALSVAAEREAEKKWVENVADLNALEEDSEELFVVIKRTSEEALMGEVAKKFPELKKISVNSYPHRLPKDFFANLARLTKLESFTFVGDARMTDEDFETLGEMVQLKRLNFSLP